MKVPSRTQEGVWYDVTIGLDGALQCDCPASFHKLDCWHVAYVREIQNMTTETTKALVPVVIHPPVSLLPSQRDLATIEKTAAMIYAGGVSLPKELNTQAKVAAVMLYGLELGLRPMTAIQGLYIINGKVSASAQIMAGLCMSREKGIQFHVEKLTDKVCTIRMQRPSRDVNESLTITWEMIQRAHLDRNAVNVQYPEDRLVYHTTKRLCRLYAPDLINGLDEGVAVAGVTEPEDIEAWELQEDDLYNEGDVDRETGEIYMNPETTAVSPQREVKVNIKPLFPDPVEHEEPVATEGEGRDFPAPPASPATPGQIAAIAEWTALIKDGPSGAAMLKAIDEGRRHAYPYAIGDGNRWSSQNLTEDDANLYIAFLKETFEAK